MIDSGLNVDEKRQLVGLLLRQRDFHMSNASQLNKHSINGHPLLYHLERASEIQVVINQPGFYRCYPENE